ncbi:MAG: hypothetical protein A3B31_00565 [Candidatus Komeilibacteria bacterium RIFCSPLOWO2_01_FULL_53_11]|uniref:Blue (type 1) copper domain-containing protein n=1 Tax=Candidatus Komeilibacteria bacterium RIFCSPLOWO2_01_FULL_53_11 TaxID=1798552 RepID=A0A1G2BQS1_9BACT|nr:MAG: hypothetical protein A3B31_00565 [Candidatus Komeilibacteria bacterium RIFCSPLOWO2_01_FULL_53_11]
MNRNVIGIIAVIVVIGGGWYMLRGAPTAAPILPVTETPAGTGATTTTATGVTVAYTNQGFSPTSVTVPLGTAVTFINQSSGNMWVASAAHPTHTVYSGTSLNQHCPDTTNSTFDECVAVTSGNSYSFTFNKVGDWKYHNHANASQTGTVIVTDAAPI